MQEREAQIVKKKAQILFFFFGNELRRPITEKKKNLFPRAIKEIVSIFIVLTLKTTQQKARERNIFSFLPFLFSSLKYIYLYM